MNEITVTGMKDINRELFLIQDKLERRILRQSLVKAGRPVVASIKENISSKLNRRTGALLRSIGQWFYGTDNVLYIGPRTGRRATKMKLADGSVGKADAWYAHFLEFGTSGHGKRTRLWSSKIITDTFGFGKRVKTAKTLGYAKKGTGIIARPFMRPAWDEHKNSVPEQLAKELREQLGL